MPHVRLLGGTCCWPELGHKSSKWTYKKAYPRLTGGAKCKREGEKGICLREMAVCLQKHTLASEGKISGGMCLLWRGICKGAESFAAALAAEGIFSFFTHWGKLIFLPWLYLLILSMYMSIAISLWLPVVRNAGSHLSCLPDLIDLQLISSASGLPSQSVPLSCPSSAPGPTT